MTLTAPTDEPAGGLYALLPRLYKRRDAEEGYPLRALLGVIEGQRRALKNDLLRLYDDWFIETCEDWVVPYIGALVGHQPLHGYEEALGSGTCDGRRLLRAAAPRNDVADTVANRRRKGTLSVLEDLAVDAGGWPAHAVELRRLLGVLQSVRLCEAGGAALTARLARGRRVDLRHGDALDRIDGPFDELSHDIDVRRIDSRRRAGRYDIPNVGVFVWRLGAYSVTNARAFCRDGDRGRYTFSILGNDTPLLTLPMIETSATHVTDESNVPAFIRRRALAERTAQYYGPGKSICIRLGRADADPVELARIVPADLSGWVYVPPPGTVAVDPALGRIALPPRSDPDMDVWVTYHAGFSADIGGGEYRRPIDRRPAGVYRVGPGGDFDTIAAAVAAWTADKRGASPPPRAAIELTGSIDHAEPVELRLDLGDELTVRSAPGCRGVIRVLDWYASRSDAVRIVGTGEGSGNPPCITLDGLLVAGRGVRVQGDVACLTVRHCTLVPGWTVDERCVCEHPDEPSIELIDTATCLQLERSIVGSILVDRREASSEPGEIFASDTVIDAVDPAGWAVIGANGRHAHVRFSAQRTTVFGGVRAHAVGLVENSIVTGELHAARRDEGCVRFCYLAPGSRAPSPFHCEPAHSDDPVRVVPHFTSTIYGTPGYAQLALSAPQEIWRGADDGAEMGAFHDLFEPVRLDNMTLRIGEFTPAANDSAVIFIT